MQLFEIIQNYYPKHTKVFVNDLDKIAISSRCTETHSGGTSKIRQAFEKTIPNGFDYNGLLHCAGSHTGEASVCQGDSGGCLVINNWKGDKKSYFQQVGITQGTYNLQCEVDGGIRSGYPSIFTSTSNPEISNFIASTIGLEGAYICEK